MFNDTKRKMWYSSEKGTWEGTTNVSHRIKFRITLLGFDLGFCFEIAIYKMDTT